MERNWKIGKKENIYVYGKRKTNTKPETETDSETKL